MTSRSFRTGADWAKEFTTSWLRQTHPGRRCLCRLPAVPRKFTSFGSKAITCRKVRKEFICARPSGRDSAGILLFRKHAKQPPTREEESDYGRYEKMRACGVQLHGSKGQQVLQPVLS